MHRGRFQLKPPRLSLFQRTHEPEVRQITAVFCDLVGSTELSEKLDPEDLRTLIDAYRKTCDTAIRRYDGQVANYAGDGLMAFFGWPRAHEDDAVRAVHAGLAILSEVTRIRGAATLASRVGICSGRVVVGQTGGPGGWMEAVGETPNIAARLQAFAAPNTLLVSGSTQRLASGVFDFQDIGTQELKGVTKAASGLSRRFCKAKNEPFRGGACEFPHSAYRPFRRTRLATGPMGKN